MAGFLIVVVFSMHLVCMNLAAAAPMCCLGFEIAESRGGILAGKVGRWLASISIYAFIAGSLLGLLLGWLIWTDAFANALRVVYSRVFFGVFELAFSLLLMVPYAIWWQYSKPKTSLWLRLLRMSLPLLAGTNLLYHFPMLFGVVARLSASSPLPADPMTSAEFRAIAFSAEFVARSLHFSFAAVAVCGAAVIAYAAFTTLFDESEQKRVASWGGWLMLVPTFLQLPVGIWLLLESPRLWQVNLMGGDAIATSLFVLSIGGAFWLMHLTSNIAMGDSSRRTKAIAVALVVVVILLMTGVLQRARTVSSAFHLPVIERSHAA